MYPICKICWTQGHEDGTLAAQCVNGDCHEAERSRAIWRIQNELLSLRAMIEARPATQQPHKQNVLRLRAPNGEYVDGIITKWEWLTRPHQEYTEHESALDPSATIKTPSMWNCGTVGLVVRLTGSAGMNGSENGSD